MDTLCAVMDTLCAEMDTLCGVEPSKKSNVYSEAMGPCLLTVIRPSWTNCATPRLT